MINYIEINFNETNSYDVLDSTGIETSFTSKDTVLVNLPNQNIEPGSIKLYDQQAHLSSLPII